MSLPSDQSSGQPAIEDYALIGDCRTAALVSRAGSIDWLCLPHYSSPAVFASLLDGHRGGSFSIQPAGPFTCTRRYCGPTPVLETTFETVSGTARVFDLLPVLDGVKTLQPMREVQRIVRGIRGVVDLEVHIDPRPDFDRAQPRVTHGRRLGWRYSWSNELLIVRTDMELERSKDALRGSVRIRAGEHAYVSLSYSRGDPGTLCPLGNDADERLELTLQWWREWSAQCTYAGPYRDLVLRSALTLKLVTYSLSGAIVAAPTTSLPETVGGARNWDYRYCWLRDAGLTMRAFVGLGFHEEARAFLSWLLHATRLTWPELQVVYDVYGRTRLPERTLNHLSGYRCSTPVRVGNGAYSQRQLDVYGEVVLAADAFVASGGALEPAEARMLRGFGNVVCKQWRTADHGIWEVRGQPRHYTFSKVMCWLALDRLIGLHEQAKIDLGASLQEFVQQRIAIRDVIETRGFNEAIASYTSELDGNHLDASLLLISCLRYRPATDPRIASTYEQITRRLGRNGLIYRYDPDYDGFDPGEGAFGICSLWAVDHLACTGAIREATHLFEHVAAFGNDVGLFGEEIDPRTGAALGNFPQAFTHVGIINAALAIERARAGQA
jgi:GH15 family glucan-1,4-alpha-glucosidase